MVNKILEYKEFEEYMNRKSFSQNSKEAYRKDINDFFIFLDYKPLKEIQEDDILSFINHLKKTYSNNSINRKIISIRGYLKYFYKNGVIDTLPLERIKNLTPQKKELKILTLEEIKKIRDAMGDSPKEYRDKVIFDTLHNTGLLISEVLELRCEKMIEEQYKTITLTKGNEIKRIPIGEGLGKSFKIFIEEHRESLRNKNSKIFSSVSRQNYRARLIKYGKSAGIKRDIYTHMIRNSVLKNILESEGAHIVKEKMGYSTIQNTSLYQGRNTKEIKKIYMEIAIGDEK